MLLFTREHANGSFLGGLIKTTRLEIGIGFQKIVFEPFTLGVSKEADDLELTQSNEEQLK